MTVKSMAESPRLVDRKIRGGKEDRWLNRKLQTVGRETRLLGGLHARTKMNTQPQTDGEAPNMSRFDRLTRRLKDKKTGS